MNFSSYRKHMLSFVGSPYLFGGESQRGTDCSGLLRSFFNLEWTAHGFYKNLFLRSSGDEIGAVFYFDEGHAYHVIPLVGESIGVDANDPEVALVVPRGGVVRYVY